MPFEYQTICKPNNFWPFEYLTTPVFRWLLYYVFSVEWSHQSNTLPHLFLLPFSWCRSHLLLDRGQLLLVELLQLHQHQLIVGLVAEQDLHILVLQGLKVRRTFGQLAARGGQVVDVSLTRFHSLIKEGKNVDQIFCLCSSLKMLVSRNLFSFIISEFFFSNYKRDQGWDSPSSTITIVVVVYM